MTPVFGNTDQAKGHKSVERHLTVLPDLVIYDPELTLELSPKLTASTAMNALAHCVEACYALDVNPLVPAVAREGIRRIVRSLPLCIANGLDLEAREDLMTGAYLAGFSIGNARMALHHGICHVLGAKTGVAHGVLNAIMLPHVMRFMSDAVPDVMSDIADAMDAGARTRDFGAAPRAVAALVATLPVPQRLRDAGVVEGILDAVAAEAASNSRIRVDPKAVKDADVREILRAAW
jgi:alcohol dehydrogenase class IV